MTDKKNTEKLGFTGLDDLLDKKDDAKSLTTFAALSENSNNEVTSNKSVADQSSNFIEEGESLANKKNWRKTILVFSVVTILVSSILFYVNTKKSEETGPWNSYQPDVASENNQVAPAADTTYGEINDAAPAAEEASTSSSEPYIKDPYAADNQTQPSWQNSDPNGNPWPKSSGYLDSFQKENTGGLSNLTIDNTGNDADVYVKLCSINTINCDGVRHVLIKAGDKFTMHKISPGSYDVRYRDLKVGSISKSEPFVLEEISMNDGTQFSEMTMTLYKVRNGNMHTTSISESEF